MKGTLIKREKNWVIEYYTDDRLYPLLTGTQIKEIPLHPYIEPDYEFGRDMYGEEVEFEIEDFWETGLEEVIKVANIEISNTPKERAEKIWIRIRNLVKHPESPFTEYEDDIAKQNTLFAIDDDKATECALFLVNQVIQVLNTLCERQSYDPFESPLSYLREWKQIKQEIEKL